MLFAWSAECGAEDPVLVVPWSDPTGVSRFVDLREDPYATEEIVEAETQPAMLQALRALNAPRSAVFTAKCGVWLTTEDVELEELRFELGVDAELARAGFFSYVDVLWRDRAIFTSFHQHEQLLDRMERRVEPMEAPMAKLECVVRPALVDLSGPQEGFAMTVYVKGVGVDGAAATTSWRLALEGAVGLLRSKELTPNT